ncbi:MAG TPA: hypothetical protein VF306_23740 [Pirellulales bacterium]
MLHEPQPEPASFDPAGRSAARFLFERFEYIQASLVTRAADRRFNVLLPMPGWKA